MAVTGEDDLFTSPRASHFRASGVGELVMPFLDGSSVRDWSLGSLGKCVYPYDDDGRIRATEQLHHWLWRWRRLLQSGVYFGKTQEQRGRDWAEYYVVTKASVKPRLRIVYAETVSHNHFV